MSNTTSDCVYCYVLLNIYIRPNIMCHRHICGHPLTSAVNHHLTEQCHIDYIKYSKKPVTSTLSSSNLAWSACRRIYAVCGSNSDSAIGFNSVQWVNIALRCELCVWKAVSSHLFHHSKGVLLAQFSLYVHKGGLKPYSVTHSIISTAWSLDYFTIWG